MTKIEWTSAVRPAPADILRLNRAFARLSPSGRQQLLNIAEVGAAAHDGLASRGLFGPGVELVFEWSITVGTADVAEACSPEPAKALADFERTVATEVPARAGKAGHRGCPHCGFAHPPDGMCI